MRSDNTLARSLPLLIGLGLFVSCAPSGPSDPGGLVVLDEEPPAEALERARATADELGREVVATLFRALESGNPVEAIEVCSVKAREMSAERSTNGLVVRRVSRKFRNPAGEPDVYEYRRLRELQALHDAGQLPEESAQVVVENGQRSLRYLKPLVLKQPCLMCHGPVTGIDDAVRDALRARYPGDRAIGYEADDLRGAISVTVEL